MNWASSVTPARILAGLLLTARHSPTSFCPAPTAFQQRSRLSCCERQNRRLSFTIAMSNNTTPNIVILGAGIAGLATAYHLSVKHGIKNIAIVDERAPMELTSSRGTMAYRNWFPGPGDAMVQLMNRSIDLLQEIDAVSNQAVQLSQNGYLYFTAQESQIETWRELARDAQQRGVGEFREHHTADTYIPSPRSPVVATLVARNGTDLIADPDIVHQLFPCVTQDAVAMLHVRRCGAFDVPRMGAWLLQHAQAHGAQFIRDRVEKITTHHNRIESIHLASGAELSTCTLILAAGPLLPEIARMLEIEIRVYNELHAKITLRDTARVFPNYGDLMLWNDPQTLEWNETGRAAFSKSDSTRRLPDEFPGGVHFLPKGTAGDPKIMGLWTYDIHEMPYQESPTYDPYLAEITLRGLARFIPAASVYIGRGNEAVVDGGYYCKTRENRPLIGPLPVQGTYVIGALSGFGVMASQGAADLVSKHIVGTALPDYAKWFLLSRYQDPEYQQLLQLWDARSGQL